MRLGIILVALALFTGAVYADPIRVEPDKECKEVWRKQGFSANGEPGRNTLFAVGGKETYPEFYQRLSRGECWKEWVVIIYMAADNDLSPYSFRDLWEMEGVGSVPSMDALVFHDGAAKDGLRYYHIAKRAKEFDYQGKLKSYIKKEGLESRDPREQEEAFLSAEGQSFVQSPVIATKEEGDSGDTGTAGEFLRHVFEKYPSRRVLLIGWSHGEGFDSEAMKIADGEFKGKQGGFAFDFLSKSHMAVTEMTKGLKGLLQGYRQNRPVDIAGSDACLNQQVEFGFEWMGLADYVFGSSTIVQKKGFNYSTLLGWFRDRPLFDTAVLARAIPDLYGKSVSKQAHGKYSSYADPNATMATWSTEALKPLKNALSDLGKNLSAWVLAPEKRVAKRGRARDLNKRLESAIRLGGVSNDLLNFFQVVEDWARGEKEKAQASDKLLIQAVLDEIALSQRALTQAVTAYFIGEAYQKGLLRTSRGAAVWLPANQQEYDEMYPKFEKSSFYQGEREGELSTWATFVKLLYTLPAESD